jgi:hypothetical protein
MQFSSSTSLLRFLTVLVSVLFFASSSLASDSRASSSTCVTNPNQTFVISRAGTTVAKIGVTISSRAGLLAEALNDITKTSIRGGARTLEEIFSALKGTGSVLQDVVEASLRCNACISRTQTAMRGLNKTLGLQKKEALEKIANWARGFSVGVKSRVDDFMYTVLDFCVGGSPTPERIQRCERLLQFDLKGCLLDVATSRSISTRTIDCTHLLPVPSVRNGEFNTWFNSLTEEELWALWSNPSARATIERRLRHPGGLHEWFMVAEAPTFKSWGMTAEDIKAIRTEISEIKLINPVGVHSGSEGSLAHIQIQEIIRNSISFEQFKIGINSWAQYRLPNGISDLPEALRLR